MKIQVEHIYSSISCNRIPEITDWNSNGIICYGASNSVVIYNTKVKGKDSVRVLSHHKSQVNSVKWLRKKDDTCSELLSCSADKTATIWTLEDEWKVSSTLVGHSDGVTCGHGAYVNDTDIVVCTGSIDSTVKIWKRTNEKVHLHQTINLNSGLCLTLHVHFINTVQNPILLCALDDHKIHVYAEKDEDWHRVHTLIGHEDWVRGLDVLDVDNETLLVASASQDTYIRLWRIQLHKDQDLKHGIKVEEKVFPAYSLDWSVKLEAVLAGHEGWVYGIQWHPYYFSKDTTIKKPVYRLLSSSLDKTLIIWEPESSGRNEGEGVWVERVRVGEVGGNGLGFYGSRFGPDGDSFMGHGYNGSLHIWALNKETMKWEPRVVCGGHFGGVEDVRWEPVRGRYLVSVSADQTTRVHAPWRTGPDGEEEWHEIARPQVHGYDMASVALISSTTFASAAEEKVIRVFQAPHNFVQNFKNITGESLIEEDNDNGLGPEGAAVPSLGLSNKAVFCGERGAGDRDEDLDAYFVPLTLTAPPTEETLMQNTLWPETQKLYGHGYEVYCLDASPDGALLASACRATNAEHASIILWETTGWQQLQKLAAHQLTVTQLAFSPDGARLLSVSRDRRWALHERGPAGLFARVAGTDKTNGVHTRIIWCCAWAPEGDAFATGSRDGKVCVWSKTGETSPSSLGEYGLLGRPLELPDASVTAVAFVPLPLRGHILAAGLESGIIKLYQFSVDGWILLRELNNSEAHHRCVRRLASAPRGRRAARLASCGADHLVRVFDLSAT